LEEIEFKSKAVKRDREYNAKGINQQKEIEILKIFPKYMKQISTDLRGERFKYNNGKRI
jgi:hypothetical protein